MRHRTLDLLSIVSTLTHDTWFERVVQTAAALELMRQFPLTRANGLRNPRAFANGQFMLFRRDAYAAVGGHEAVKDALLEDLALARLIHARGLSAGVFMADGLFHCRMYADWAQFRRGWKRIFTEAADRKAKRLVLWAWRLRFLGTILPAWMLIAGIVGALFVARDPVRGWTLVALSLAALAVWLGALSRIRAVARAPRWTAPLHIAGAWMTGRLLAEAARDLRAHKPTHWGGREYDLLGQGLTRTLAGLSGHTRSSSVRIVPRPEIERGAEWLLAANRESTCALARLHGRSGTAMWRPTRILAISVPLPIQRKRKMAAHAPSRFEFDQRRRLVGASRLHHRATRMEAASRGRIHRARNLALQDDGPVPPARVDGGIGRQQRRRVGMGGRRRRDRASWRPRRSGPDTSRRCAR